MTDRELLELAAKAAGIEFYTPEGMGEPWFEIRSGCGFYLRGCVVWNPLADDGDALRLAVKLRINLNFDDGVEASRGDDAFGFLTTASISADTRRAIVRAAAEIGKAMS